MLQHVRVPDWHKSVFGLQIELQRPSHLSCDDVRAAADNLTRARAELFWFSCVLE